MRSQVTTHDDDLLGPEPLRRDDAAEADRAVADHGDRAAGANPGGDRRMVTGAHHVRKGEQRGHQRIVFADTQRVQGAVGLRDAQRLGLRAAGLAAVPKKPPWTQAVCRPSSQNMQLPSE